MGNIWPKAKTFFRENYQICLAAGVFLLIQFFYSWLLWHRAGNLPPVPSDSYNYIFNIHQIGADHRFFTDPRQLVYGGFNYIYSLVISLFGLSPLAVYHLFFYLGKIVLLGALVYFLKPLIKNKGLLALVIIALGVYSGTGDAHGFYWVVPSFWSVLLLFVLIGMAMRRVAFFPMLVIAIFFMFVHPLSIYTFVPIVLSFFALKFLSSPEAAKFRRLALIFLVALIFQQSYVTFLDKKLNSPGDVNQLNQAISVATTGVGLGLNPQGGSITQSANTRGKVSVGLLTIRDALDKIHTAPSSSYHYHINIPSALFRFTPSTYELWNAYGFYLAPSPILVLLYLLIFILMLRWEFKKKDVLIVLFVSSLVTAIGATIHPQGFRFIVYIWPLTICAYVSFLWLATVDNKRLRIGALILIAFFMIEQLTYGVFMARRVGSFEDYSWNRTCASDLITKTKNNPNMVLFYSGSTLAPTAFVGEGLYTIPGIGEASWQSFLDMPENKAVSLVFLNDQMDGYAPAGTVAKLDEEIDKVAEARGKHVSWQNCGSFRYGEEN